MTTEITSSKLRDVAQQEDSDLERIADVIIASPENDRITSKSSKLSM